MEDYTNLLTKSILKTVELDPIELFKLVLLILGSTYCTGNVFKPLL